MGDPVKVWGMDDRIPIGTQAVAPMLIGHEKEDVRASRVVGQSRSTSPSKGGGSGAAGKHTKEATPGNVLRHDRQLPCRSVGPGPGNQAWFSLSDRNTFLVLEGSSEVGGERRAFAATRPGPSARHNGTVQSVMHTEKLPDEKRPSPVRALLIGTVLVPAGVFFGAYAYLIIQALTWAQTSLQLGSVFTLFIVAVLNGFVGLIAKPLKLRQGEQLLIYIMMCLAACLSGNSFVPFLVNTMVAGRYYATPENKWADFHDLLPSFFGPTDDRIIRWYYEGSGTLYSPEVLREWAVPLAYWGAMIILLMMGAVFIANLLGKQWVHRERLTFPLVQLPLEMTSEGTSSHFWRNKYMWAGLLTAAILESIDFINYLYPSVPTVWLKARRVEAWASSTPWNAIRPFSVAFFPFMIGIGFLLTRDASFSCWFFYLLGKLATVGCAAAGLRGGGSKSGLARLPLMQEQGAGGLLGIMAGAMWVAKGSLREAWRRKEPDETAFINPRYALGGFVAVMVALTLMASAAGLTPTIGVLYFGLYFLFVTAIGRVVAETGAGWTMVQRNRAHQLVMALLGGRRFTAQGLTSFMVMDWLDNDYRDTPVVHLLSALKMRHDTGKIPAGQLLAAVSLTTVVGLISSFWTFLHIYYSYGAATAKVRPWFTAVGRQPYQQLADALNFPQPPDLWGLAGSAFGFIVVLVLGVARQMIPNFMLHPVGYAIANTASMEYLWMPFLIAWALKSVVLRYGGIKVYHRMVPFALGAILGDLVAPGLWGLYGTLVGRQMYMFFPH